MSNSEAPTPKVSVSDAAASPSASPVSVGGASGFRLTAPPGVVSAPATMRSAAAVHFRSRARTWAGSFVVRSSATKCSRSWAGVMMPAWCWPRNGTTPAGAGSAAGVPTAYPAAAPTPASATPAPVQPSNRRRDRPPAGRAGSSTWPWSGSAGASRTRWADESPAWSFMISLRQDVTTPATWLTGSPSASTASLIFLVSSGVSSVYSL